MNFPDYKSKGGFTLVELIIVVVIMGVIAAMAVPSVITFFDNYRLQGAAREVMLTMQLAKMKAISKNLQYKVDLTPTGGPAGGTYLLQEGNKSSGSDTWTTIETHNLSDYANTILYSSTNDPIFNPRGTISNLTTVVVKNTKGDSYQISTSIAGRIKLVKQ